MQQGQALLAKARVIYQYIVNFMIYPCIDLFIAAIFFNRRTPRGFTARVALWGLPAGPGLLWCSEKLGGLIEYRSKPRFNIHTSDLGAALPRATPKPEGRGAGCPDKTGLLSP